MFKNVKNTLFFAILEQVWPRKTLPIQEKVRSVGFLWSLVVVVEFFS